jgi:hypothetical protein
MKRLTCPVPGRFPVVDSVCSAFSWICFRLEEGWLMSAMIINFASPART